MTETKKQSGENATQSNSSGLTVPAVRSRKRGLTVSAPSPDDLKKVKVDAPPLPPLPKTEAKSSVQPPHRPEPSETAPVAAVKVQKTHEDLKTSLAKDWTDGAKSKKKHQQPRIYRLPGNGPHTFFASEEALSQIVDGDSDVDACFMVLKSTLQSVVSAFPGICEEDVSELMDNVGFWEVELDEEAKEAAETKEAEAWRKIWAALDTPQGGWYEVTVQREKPAEGVPAIEFRWCFFLDWYHIAEDQQGSWWLTGVAVPDEASSKLALVIDDHIPQYFYV